MSRLYRVRREAGIGDVPLHELRHTHASHAVMNGVPVPVVSRLLGHADVSMTLRYAHLGDRDIEDSAERVGQAVAAFMSILVDNGFPIRILVTGARNPGPIFDGRSGSFAGRGFNFVPNAPI